MTSDELRALGRHALALVAGETHAEMIAWARSIAEHPDGEREAMRQLHMAADAATEIAAITGTPPPWTPPTQGATL